MDATPPMTINDPDLRDLDRDLRSVLGAVRLEIVDLEPEVLTGKPDPKSWNILQCFKHLTVTGELYYPRLEQHIARLEHEELRSRHPYRPGWFGRTFIRWAGPNTELKVKAPGKFRPGAIASDDLTAVSHYLEQQKTLLGLIARADGWTLNRPKFRSPVPIFRFTLGEGLELMVRHQERHLGQARRILGSRP